MLERDLQRAIMKAARARGLGCDKIEPAGRRGVPDLLVWRAGRHIWLEVKTSTGRLTPLQERDHAQRRKLNDLVCVVRSLADAEALLDSWCRGNGWA